MRILHTGEKVDQSDQRYKSSGRFVRFLYSAVLLAAIAYAIFFFGRPYLFLEGPGTVTAPSKDIAVGFDSDVALVHVKPGDLVYPGSLLVTINRLDYDIALDEINSALTNRSQDISRIRQELQIAERVIPTLRRRVAELRKVLDKTDARPGIMDLSTQTTLQREYSQATFQLEENLARLDELPGLLPRLLEDQKRLARRKSEISVTWRNHQIMSDQQGTVSSSVVSEGDTVLTGEVMMQILDQRRRYIIWQLPQDILRLPRLGEEVVVEGAALKISGQVDRFAPVSDLAPAKGEARTRLVYVAVDGEDAQGLPLQSSVTVRMRYF